MILQMNENDANLINAIDFINETKQPEEEKSKAATNGNHYYREAFLRAKILYMWNVLLSALLL